MDIVDYNYDRENYQENAQKALKAKKEADKVLLQREAEIGVSGKVSMDYYKAYLNYMSTDNAYMKTILDYIKYYYDTMVFYSIDKDSDIYMDFAKQAKQYFEEYYQLYEELKEAETSFKTAVDKAIKDKVDLSDMEQLAVLHTNLIENFREKDIFPFFDRCNELIPSKAIVEDSEMGVK